MDQRVREFQQNQARQQQMLQQARQELANEEARSDRLEKQHSENDLRITNLTQQRDERLGEFGELFGVTRQVAGDLRGILDGSLSSAQYPGRDEFLSEFAAKQDLPRIEEIRQLWASLLQEMIATGEIVKFPATVVTAQGQQTEMDVTRIGVFNAIADGKYLDYDSETAKLKELARQPAGRYLSMVSDFESADSGFHNFGVDPSRGSIISLLVQTPSWRERIDYGGVIGYLTLALGVVGAIMAVIQFLYLLMVGGKVRVQMKKSTASTGNPLGRVMKVYEDNPSVDVETLELKLDEAILKNTPPLERFLTMIKVLAVVAPLLGLLGTVTGMINTFQAITLFGTGDPKLMANGISQALVTTMEGLWVAIPLTFLHALVASRSRSIINTLEEQAAGIVAVHAEKQ
jgi:biopolymer transport protein ExbB